MNYKIKHKDIYEMIQKYYFDKAKIKYLQDGILLAEKHLKALKHDLEESNFVIDADRISSPKFDTRVQISDISTIDNILIDGYERLIKRMMERQDFITKSRLEIIKIEDRNLLVDSIFTILTDEEMTIIYNYFGLKKSAIQVMMDCYFTKKVFYNRLESAFNKMSEFNKEILEKVG